MGFLLPCVRNKPDQQSMMSHCWQRNTTQSDSYLLSNTVLQGGKQPLGMQRQTQPRWQQYLGPQCGLSWTSQGSSGALVQATRLQQCQCHCALAAIKAVAITAPTVSDTQP